MIPAGILRVLQTYVRAEENNTDTHRLLSFNFIRHDERTVTALCWLYAALTDGIRRVLRGRLAVPPIERSVRAIREFRGEK